MVDPPGQYRCTLARPTQPAPPGQKEKMFWEYDTGGSRVITDLSTNQACSCLTSQIGRDEVLSTKYGRTRWCGRSSDGTKPPRMEVTGGKRGCRHCFLLTRKWRPADLVVIFVEKNRAGAGWKDLLTRFSNLPSDGKSERRLIIFGL